MIGRFFMWFMEHGLVVIPTLVALPVVALSMAAFGCPAWLTLTACGGIVGVSGLLLLATKGGRTVGL